MANINEILARAAALREETALNSISPERAGGIMYDTLMALNELWLQQGAALVISKIYASVDAMEADTNPVSDISGKPLRPGQIVVIASEDEDNGSVYRYNGTDSPSWSLVGNIGNLEPVDSLDSDSTQLPLAAHQGKVLDGKISQLGQGIGTRIKLEATAYSTRLEANVRGGVAIELNANFCIFMVVNVTDGLNQILVPANFTIDKYTLNAVGDYKITFARTDNTALSVNDDIVKSFNSFSVNNIQTFPIIDVNEIIADNSDLTAIKARQSVPIHLRKPYVILKYKSNSKCVFEQYVEQAYDETAWMYGRYMKLFSGNFIYINEIVGNVTNKDAARNPAGVKIPMGSIIIYQLDNEWHVELHTANSTSTLDDFWTEIAFKDYVKELIELLKQDLPNYDKYQRILLTDDYEIGGIDNNGDNVDVPTNIRTINKIPAIGGSIIQNGTSIVAVYYDDSDTFISKSGTWTTDDITIPDGVAYVRIVINNPYNLNKSFFNKLVRVSKNLANLDRLPLAINRKYANVIYVNGWKNGYLDASGVAHDNHPKICYTPKFIPVKKGDLIRACVPYFGVVVCEYAGASESNFSLMSDGFLYNNFIKHNLKVGEYIVKRDGYVRLEIRKQDENGDDVNITASDVGEVVCIVNTLGYNERKVVRDNKIYKPRIDLLSIQEQQSIVGNGGTIIGNELWCFGASEENDGYVRKFNLESKQVIETITHDLGHANCVDYNANTDTLLVTDALGYDSQQGRKVYLELIDNPSSKDSLLRADAIVIPLFVQDMSRYIYAQFCFGDADNILYGFEYHFWGTTAYKLMLGMGNNDYSSDVNGYGTFIPGKTSRQYNGTAKLIKVYTGKIHEGIDTIAGEQGGAQDMCYNGHLFLCWSIGIQNILEIELDDVSDTFSVVKDYTHTFYEDSEGYYDYEPEIVAEQDGKLYAGSRHVVRENNIVTKIKGIIFSFEK